MVAPSALVRPVAKPRHRVELDRASDPDGDRVVTVETIRLVGRTAPRATVRLDLAADGRIEKVSRANSKGRYEFVARLPVGTTPLVVLANLRRRRLPAAKLLVTRVDPAPPPPRPDTTAPTLTIDGPEADALLTASPVVRGRVVDDRPGEVRLEARLNAQGFVAVAVAPDGTFQYDPNLPADGTADGSHTIALRAIDAAGNVSELATRSFRLVTPRPEDRHSEGRITVEGVSTSAFNPLTTAVRFVMTGASFDTQPGAVSLLNNGQPLSADQYAVQSDRVELIDGLVDGLNTLTLVGADHQGDPLVEVATVWVGTHTLSVSIVDELGQPVTGPVSVTALLLDDQQFQIQASTEDGQVVFEGIPDRTILIEARTADRRVGTIGVTGSAGAVEVRLVGFDQPSPIENNDFNLGTAEGWEIGSAPVEIVSHVENLGVQDVDYDLVLSTSGGGEQRISRTFVTQPETTSVRVRYRFVTSEVPGGFFGSQYNDYFSVLIRGSGGGIATETNSMNGLGLAAFDASGATSWRETTLAVGAGGETIQVDIVVANVSDGALDSQVVVDLIEELGFAIEADSEHACPNESTTFRVQGSPQGTITWSSDGNPATGSGLEHTTRFATSGVHTVTATLTTPSGQIRTATATISVKELSGAAWVERFPDRADVSELTGGFRTSVENFLEALTTAGATVGINSVLRPAERAYLMHHAYRIANNQVNPADVPEMAGVDICWVHRRGDGTVDLAASRAAAQAMVAAYKIVYAPALHSRHTQGLAIDMNISWSGTLTILDAAGDAVAVTSPQQLWAVGATYGVIKKPNDPPHWSSDGK